MSRWSNGSIGDRLASNVTPVNLHRTASPRRPQQRRACAVCAGLSRHAWCDICDAGAIKAAQDVIRFATHGVGCKAPDRGCTCGLRDIAAALLAAVGA